MHAVLCAVSAVTARPPGLLGGEAEDRCQPGGQAGEGLIEHRAAGPALDRVRAVAVERVLADIEVEGREVDGAEDVQRLVDGVEVEVVAAPANLLVELGQAVQHPALELRHLRDRQLLRLLEAGQVADQEAQGVAQAPVGVGSGTCRISGPDADILGVVGGDDPETQNVGAALGDEFLGRD